MPLHEPEKKSVLESLIELQHSEGLSSVLKSLFRHQVACGFVLEDPLSPKLKTERYIYDKSTNIKFCVSWNPVRELRSNHEFLVRKKIISGSPDDVRLINRNEKGEPCYLCPENIAIQNPREILFPLKISGKKYFIGANYAPIAPDHFTVMNARHLRQEYSSQTLETMYHIAEKTNGVFRVAYNGRAGASIPSHEHFQITSLSFPVESIRYGQKEIMEENNYYTVIKPTYYMTVYFVKGRLHNISPALGRADEIIKKWTNTNENHSVNLLAFCSNGVFQLFIFPRDTRKILTTGRNGTMGVFECSGFIVYSAVGELAEIEKKTFENSTLKDIKKMLFSIAPVDSLKYL